MTAERPPSFRPVVAEVDLDAVRANVATLLSCAGGAALMAVVKAGGYGHGAVEVARAALDAGATWLGVALVEEGAELRAAGIDAPILLLSEPPIGAASAVVAERLTPVVYRAPYVDALAKAAEAAGVDRLAVHLKVDTGMHRVGCTLDEAEPLARKIAWRDPLYLEGVMTHLAVADEPGNPLTGVQLQRFEDVLSQLTSGGNAPDVVHAANSAATIAVPEARYDLVRCGIAVYGIAPAPVMEGSAPLRPAMRLRAEVAHVQRLPAGEGISYGQHYRLERESTVAVVPAGYADGVARRLFEVGGEVLIGGQRHPVAGAVTMDQFMVDCGDADVAPGDEVVILGRQGGEEITANEIAARLGTIGYEITCAVGPRVPRVHVG